MKKRFLPLMMFLFLALGFLSASNAQKLYFCEGVDDDGYPKNESDVFTIGSDGGYLYFLVRLPYEVGCTYVNYELYDVNYDDKEDYNTTIKQDDLGTNWVWFWKKITFYKAGTYDVYVYDCHDRILTHAKVRIKIRD